MEAPPPLFLRLDLSLEVEGASPQDLASRERLWEKAVLPQSPHGHAHRHRDDGGVGEVDEEKDFWEKRDGSSAGGREGAPELRVPTHEDAVEAAVRAASEVGVANLTATTTTTLGGAGTSETSGKSLYGHILEAVRNRQARQERQGGGGPLGPDVRRMAIRFVFIIAEPPSGPSHDEVGSPSQRAEEESIHAERMEDIRRRGEALVAGELLEELAVLRPLTDDTCKLVIKHMAKLHMIQPSGSSGNLVGEEASLMLGGNDLVSVMNIGLPMDVFPFGIESWHRQVVPSPPLDADPFGVDTCLPSLSLTPLSLLLPSPRFHFGSSVSSCAANLPSSRCVW